MIEIIFWWTLIGGASLIVVTFTLWSSALISVGMFKLCRDTWRAKT